ncbi:putative disease resistance RPP13-like protein 1 [Dichanthelium oligosanthes]|uniref:Putative disease resistance RPP13-like protein 1 n=1 Tax=Dichanthelium oligosanthes TaxID=888268 RepID=A0A1E5UNP7_9POAL|nr:putative disease resistance RPP13-like protein 1 [Dichanthelium oligosanthes]
MDPEVSTADVGWGISVAGWLVSPIISELLDKCFSYIGLPSPEKAEELQRKILQLKLMLEATEDCPQRPALEQWMKELKAAFYEAEDILDAIDYHRLKSHVQAVSRTKQDVETVMDFNVPTESRMELEESLNKLETLIDEGHKVLSLLKLPASGDNINNTPSNTVRIPTRCTSTPSVVFGRDGDLDMIRKMLHSAPADNKTSSSRTNGYSVIGIHGIPGSGKTTLAQYVCDKERDDDYFNLIMWVHVSQNCSVDTIFSEMLEIASGRKSDQLSNLDNLRWAVQKALWGKRFLLVLDDFWGDKDARQLGLLLSPLKVGLMGSRVLVTTRTADAAKALGAQNPYAIPDLDEEQFFSMFMHYALDGANISDQKLLTSHQSIGRKIAEKLGRSPLAARTVAGQLKLRLDFDFWTRTMNSDMLNNGTMATLWWCYQQLEEHVKQCFTYCSIFPRTYKLQRDDLVHLWMAEGFVKTTKETEDIEDIGHDYFHVLLSTSFIQLNRREFGKEYFTIHDLLRDLAERVAASDYFRIEKGMVAIIPKDIRHLFIVSYDESVFREEILNMTSLRTLIVSSSNKSMHVEDFRSMLKNLKKLRVVLVQVDGLSTISPCIGQQKYLRYLGLYGRTPMLTLPRRFTELYLLQKFAVRSTTPVYFHFNGEIANLVNLRYMICQLFDCPDIRRLTLLRTLSVFRVRKARGYEIQQLEHLDNLHGTLSIKSLENVERKDDAIQARLSNKVHLSDLVLQWNKDNQSSNFGNQDDRQSEEPLKTSSKDLAQGNTCDQSSVSQEEVLEALRPPFLITSLKIMNYNGSTYPSWFSGEKGALENLQHLELSNCYAQPVIGESFMCLHTLVISDCTWYSLPENMERLTLLEKLALRNCDNILSLPSLPLSVKKLVIYKCNRSLTETCQTDGHPNWEKIAHITEQHISDF